MPAIGLNSHIWNNNLRSLVLIAAYPLLLAAMVWGVAALAGAVLVPHPVSADSALIWANAAAFANAGVAAWWPTILTVVIGWFVIAYALQGRMIRALSHAHPVTRAQEPALYNLLENLCIAQGMKTPRLEIIETDALNAFASGVDDRSYAVTVTRGLLDTLAPDEIEAVLAHELAHIVNRDVRLLIVSVIFVGMIGFCAQMVWSMIRYNMFLRGGNRRDGRVILLLMAVGAILWLGYMATMVTRFALSRRREYMADAGAVAMTKNPDAMMRALLRISGNDRIPAVPDDIAMMCVENSQPFMGLFTTHPPIAERVRAIAQVTHTPVPAINPVQKRANPWIR